MECKLVFYDEIKKGEQELIDTLWNVNKQLSITGKRVFMN